MKIRNSLFAATCLALPVMAPLAAHAQPVTGPYVSLGAGTSILLPTGYSYAADDNGPVGKFTSRPSYAGVAGVGYGFGDGFRVQLDGNFFRNTAAKGDTYYEGMGGISQYKNPMTGGINTYGLFVNGLYDIPVNFPVTPYVGVGVGYQWEKLKNHLTDHFDGGYGPIFGGTVGSVAYDAILGASYQLPWVPGLSATAEYRFSQLVQNRNYSFEYNFKGFATKVGQASSNTFLLGLRYQICNAPAQVAEVSAPAPAPVAAPAPAPARTFLVFFDWDKSDLTPRATQIIAEAASDSKSSSVTTLDVSGYTDTSGTPDYNQGLSQRRAEAVAGQLETDGIPAAEIEIHAYGETHLLVPTGPGVREPQNRRVEIVLQ